MFHLVYDYPRNRELLKKYHEYYKKNPSWEPLSGGALDTIKINGVEYYKPPRQDPMLYQHLARRDLDGGISMAQAKDLAKRGSKKLVSLGLDQIPKVSGMALGALPALVGQPELAPIGAFIGSELGKQGRKYIKDKWGYGKEINEYLGGASVNYPGLATVIYRILRDSGVDLSLPYEYLVSAMSSSLKPLFKRVGAKFLDLSIPAVGKALGAVAGNQDVGDAFAHVARIAIKELTGVGKLAVKPVRAPPKRSKKMGGAECGCSSKVGVYKKKSKKGGSEPIEMMKRPAKQPRPEGKRKRAPTQFNIEVKKYMKEHGVSLPVASKAVKSMQ